MLNFLPVLPVTLALGVAAAPAAAQSGPCAPRDRVVTHLAAVYGETLQGAGRGPAAAVVELYASAATGTWTVTVTHGDGTTCLVASGTGWRAAAPGVAL
jgi:hypothetical protein